MGLSDSGTVAAVVLGGGGGGDALAQRAGVAAKALAPLQGRPMAAYVLDALAASHCTEHITYVGPIEGLEPAWDAHVPAGSRLADSLALGFGAALAQAPGRRLLALTADIPWVTASAVDTFVSGAEVVDLVYPVIPRAVAEAQFPNQERTFVKVHDGHFTGGNLVLLSPQTVPVLLSFVDRLYRGRKNPLALASLFGYDIVAKLLMGRVRIAELEARAARILGISVSAYISQDASLGADVDKLEHLGAPPRGMNAP